MRYLIIGNGPAGVFAAGQLRDLDQDSTIEIITSEDHPYYSRPLLPDLLCSEINIEDTVIYDQSWYQKKNILLRTSELVTSIDSNKKQFTTNKGLDNYDRLLLATGARPFIPDMANNIPHVIFTLRTIDDCLILKKAIEKYNSILIVGGGLLGLEIASRLALSDHQVTVVERSDHLLPRQLDHNTGQKIKEKLEQQGIVFLLNNSINDISRQQDESIVTFDDRQASFPVILFSIGVRAETSLARQCGINTDKGIIVNEYLETSTKDIYAAGDCIEYQGNCWGYVKSSIEQGKIAAKNMVDAASAKYSGSKISPRIKISGIDLAQL